MKLQPKPEDGCTLSLGLKGFNHFSRVQIELTQLSSSSKRGDAERGFGRFLRLPCGEEEAERLQLCSPDCCGCSLEPRSFIGPKPAGERPREATGAPAQPEQPQPGASFPLSSRSMPSGPKGSLRVRPRGRESPSPARAEAAPSRVTQKAKLSERLPC